jgi:uncharacterized protein YbaP (TraB family)
MALRNLLTISLFFCSSFLFGQNTILWKVTKPDNKNISYLLGTYHQFGESFIDSLPVIKEKLQTSNLIITEVKVERAKWAELYNARPSSDTLSAILSKKDIEFITDILKKGQVDITKYTPGELIAKLQAYYPMTICNVFNKTDNKVMDEYVQFLGNQLQKQLYYFETDSFQIDIIKQTLQMYDWKFFKKNVPPLLDMYRNGKQNESLCAFPNQYASFTLDYKFEEACKVLKDAKINDDLVKKRNEDWMQKLPSLLEHNNCFIAVGLGHFFNKCGLIQRLRGLGYTIEPITMK